MINSSLNVDRLRTGLLGIILIASAFVLPACSTEPDPGATDSEILTESTTESARVEGSTLGTGQFEGRSDHVVSGGVEIIDSNGQYFVQLGDDFSLDNAPDPKVGLGKDGYDPNTKAGKLIAFKGASSYPIPAGVDVQAYNEVYIWCEKFDVPLGVASIQFQ